MIRYLVRVSSQFMTNTGDFIYKQNKGESERSKHPHGLSLFKGKHEGAATPSQQTISMDGHVSRSFWMQTFEASESVGLLKLHTQIICRIFLKKNSSVSKTLAPFLSI